jgi:hypothetical protein
MFLFITVRNKNNMKEARRRIIDRKQLLLLRVFDAVCVQQQTPFPAETKLTSYFSLCFHITALC